VGNDAQGDVLIAGEPCRATREEMTTRRVFAIPEEPLKNARVAAMYVGVAIAPGRHEQ